MASKVIYTNNEGTTVARVNLENRKREETGVLAELHLDRYHYPTAWILWDNGKETYERLNTIS